MVNVGPDERKRKDEETPPEVVDARKDQCSRLRRTRWTLTTRESLPDEPRHGGQESILLLNRPDILRIDNPVIASIE